MNTNNYSHDINDQKIDDSSVTQDLFRNRKKIIYIALALIVVTVVIAGIYLLSSKSQGTPANTTADITGTKFPTGGITSATGNKQIAATVGEENIYQKNVDILVANATRGIGVDYNKLFTDKLIEESIVLQSARKDKLVTLDNSVFNSENIDLIKRSALVKQIKDAIENKADKIEGSVISIWFYNDVLGSLGLEGGKKFAFDKITPLQNQVKSGIITTKEAADRIRNDASLGQIDENYYHNAIFDFSANKGSKISFDASFDKVLWSLKEGETSDVYLLKDKNVDTGEIVDALYVFGQVTKKTAKDGANGFDAWLNDNKKLYAVRYL